MKTSNVLLILLFVISISLNSAVPIVANLKLKNRDFVEAREGGSLRTAEIRCRKIYFLERACKLCHCSFRFTDIGSGSKPKQVHQHGPKRRYIDYQE